MHKVTESVVRSENRCRDSAAEFLIYLLQIQATLYITELMSWVQGLISRFQNKESGCWNSIALDLI